MTRYTKLAQYVRKRADTPFVWGASDCCTFAADWVLEATGRDPMAALRDLYIDEGSASRMLSAPGGLARLVTTWLATDPLPFVTTAQRGDIVLYESGAGPALGICIGDKFAAMRENGVGYFSMRHAAHAWRVE